MASKEFKIPDYELDRIVQTFIPDIIAFFETEEGQKEYQEWLERKEKKRKRTTLNKQKVRELKNSLTTY
jgi:hypothetical protein